MAVFSRGFGARRRESNPELPPGQYLTEDFPVLSAGPTPRIELSEWAFAVRNESGRLISWNWDEFMALQIEDIATDIHCVTRWSKLGTSWRGVSLDTLFEHVETDAAFAMAHSYGGYTTNIPMEDLLDGKSVGRVRVRRRAAGARARRTRATARAAPVLLEEREVGARTHADERGRARILGAERLQHARRSVDRGAVLVTVGGWRPARVTRTVTATASARILELERSRLAGKRRRASTSTSD